VLAKQRQNKVKLALHMNMVWRSGLVAPFSFKPYTRWRLGARFIPNGHFSSWERISHMYWMGHSLDPRSSLDTSEKEKISCPARDWFFSLQPCHHTSHNTRASDKSYVTYSQTKEGTMLAWEEGVEFEILLVFLIQIIFKLR
jgi:hypothetical protein